LAFGCCDVVVSSKLSDCGVQLFISHPFFLRLVFSAQDLDNVYAMIRIIHTMNTFENEKCSLPSFFMIQPNQTTESAATTTKIRPKQPHIHKHPDDIEIPLW
jgi:hypothetical protein